MEVRLTKTENGCRTKCTRTDGSVVEWESPNNGKVPHDIVHWIIETKLCLHDSFYGNIARGQNDYSVSELAHSDTELAQTEKLALLIEADIAIRDGKLRADPSAVRGLYGLQYPHGCSDETVTELIDLIYEAASDWRSRVSGEEVSRTFH